MRNGEIERAFPAEYAGEHIEVVGFLKARGLKYGNDVLDVLFRETDGDLRGPVKAFQTASEVSERTLRRQASFPAVVYVGIEDHYLDSGPSCYECSEGQL